MKKPSYSHLLMILLLGSRVSNRRICAFSRNSILLNFRTKGKLGNSVCYMSDSMIESNNVLTWTENKNCWRPTKGDVERISWGKPAKKKGTGSRGVPHRLNEDERSQFDRAIQHGFLQIHGFSGWRKERRGSPILNSWRNWCDARCHPSIVLHKSTSPNSMEDRVVLDLSPLRTPEQFLSVTQQCLQYIEEQVERKNDITLTYAIENESGKDNDDINSNDQQNEEDVAIVEDETIWETSPIYHISPYYIIWEISDRSIGKEICKSLSTFFQAPLPTHKQRKKPNNVKHGKNRRHGGYGIGGQ